MKFAFWLASALVFMAGCQALGFAIGLLLAL